MKLVNWARPTLFNPICQDSVTTSSHLGSFSHIASNLNSLFRICLGARPSILSAIIEWSEAEVEICCIRAVKNFRSDQVVAKALSRWILICPSSPLFLNHVNGSPQKPRSTKPQWLITVWNRSNCLSGLKLPPSFSDAFVISLKSPIIVLFYLFLNAR